LVEAHTFLFPILQIKIQTDRNTPRWFRKEKVFDSTIAALFFEEKKEDERMVPRL
jgi:hypothetical protein